MFSLIMILWHLKIVKIKRETHLTPQVFMVGIFTLDQPFPHAILCLGLYVTKPIENSQKQFIVHFSM